MVPLPNTLYFKRQLHDSEGQCHSKQGSQAQARKATDQARTVECGSPTGHTQTDCLSLRGATRLTGDLRDVQILVHRVLGTLPSLGGTLKLTEKVDANDTRVNSDTFAGVRIRFDQLQLPMSCASPASVLLASLLLFGTGTLTPYFSRALMAHATLSTGGGANNRT